jgi:hypothetical protein
LKKSNQKTFGNATRSVSGRCQPCEAGPRKADTGLAHPASRCQKFFGYFFSKK